MQRAEFLAHARVENSHWWFTARRHILQQLIGAIATPGTAVADLGCGTGGNVAALAREYRVVGLDPSSDAIELARAHHRDINFIQTDDPGCAREHLAQGGVMLMTDVLEHVEHDEALLRQAVAAVPEGGHVLITVPADPSLWSRHDVQFRHYRRYLPDTLRRLWRELPVRERLLSPFNARLRPAIAAIRRYTREGGRDLAIPAGPLNGALRTIFSGEAPALVRAIDGGTPAFRRGVSLAAILQKQ